MKQFPLFIFGCMLICVISLANGRYLLVDLEGSQGRNILIYNDQTSVNRNIDGDLMYFQFSSEFHFCLYVKLGLNPHHGSCMDNCKRFLGHPAFPWLSEKECKLMCNRNSSMNYINGVCSINFHNKHIINIICTKFTLKILLHANSSCS